MIYSVTHPQPIIYTFGSGGLERFEWVKDYDRKHGKYASNRQADVIRCSALQFDRNRRVLSLTHDSYLSINGPILTQIALYFAHGQRDKSFESPRDLKLFFENPSNSLNEADDWWGSIGTHLFIGTPLEDIDAATPMSRIYSEQRNAVAEERSRNPEFWARLRPSGVKRTV
ncbi:hypothetical protein [Bradyrhizobium sp. AUGA SZCCT0431]|uniref:hypothetical protein n=1 Tax=Bradyrhizobium sp. AUGA SZCCT0431 TaxID=2807674 RepID=UPI001BAB53C7|nr:hypothetical protein [Bradyrhizobium sp. AUGA SZCCT0431]MBR1143686.1 hypothetical protein [Bradyrhizobium sp. AUGA SZCCT0431]